MYAPSGFEREAEAGKSKPSRQLPDTCTNHNFKVLELLQKGAREYYRQPSAKCTTWSYFVPFPPPKKADAPLVIGGMEIYTEKQALQKQIDDPVFFQAFHETAKKESLYAKEEELVAWYLTAGFVAREQHAKPFGGNLISLSKFVGDREAILKALGCVYLKE